jgi:hypothetical protein
MSARPKAPGLLEQIREKVEAGRLLYSKHASERMAERGIIKPEIEFVLKNGRNNKRKDSFNEEFSGWDYAIEGKTVDGRKLRIVVAQVEPNLLVISTIDLSAGV